MIDDTGNDIRKRKQHLATTVGHPVFEKLKPDDALSSSMKESPATHCKELYSSKVPNLHHPNMFVND